MNPTVVITFYTLDRSTLLMARMTRPGGIHILYVVLLIKINIFPIFHPKMWKILSYIYPTSLTKCSAYSFTSLHFSEICQRCKVVKFHDRRSLPVCIWTSPPVNCMTVQRWSFDQTAFYSDSWVRTFKLVSKVLNHMLYIHVYSPHLIDTIHKRQNSSQENTDKTISYVGHCWSL